MILLVLTVLVHLRQGSTRIRLRGQEGRSIRLDLASRLLKDIKPVPGTIGVEPAQAVELVETLIDSQKLEAIVGLAGRIQTVDRLAAITSICRRCFTWKTGSSTLLRQRLEAEIETYDDANIERAHARRARSPGVAQRESP